MAAAAPPPRPPQPARCTTGEEESGGALHHRGRPQPRRASDHSSRRGGGRHPPYGAGAGGGFSSEWAPPLPRGHAGDVGWHRNGENGGGDGVHAGYYEGGGGRQHSANPSEGAAVIGLGGAAAAGRGEKKAVARREDIAAVASLEEFQPAGGVEGQWSTLEDSARRNRRGSGMRAGRVEEAADGPGSGGQRPRPQQHSQAGASRAAASAQASRGAAMACTQPAPPPRLLPGSPDHVDSSSLPWTASSEDPGSISNSPRNRWLGLGLGLLEMEEQALVQGLGAEAPADLAYVDEPQLRAALESVSMPAVRQGKLLALHAEQVRARAERELKNHPPPPPRPARPVSGSCVRRLLCGCSCSGDLDKVYLPPACGNSHVSAHKNVKVVSTPRIN